jgi:hypothetical protein
MTKLVENNPRGTANIADDRVLATVLRPQMADEALELIEQGKEIEMENQYVFAFMRCAENNRRKNLNFKCRVNKYNKGWTAIQK